MLKKIHFASPNTMLQLRQEPIAEQIQRKSKLIIIDDEKNQVKLLSIILSQVCIVPPNLPQVKSFEQAKNLVEIHHPDIMICDKTFAKEGDHFRVLEFAKSRNKKARVILFSGYANENDTLHVNGFRFDCIMTKGSIDKSDLVAIALMFSKKE